MNIKHFISQKNFGDTLARKGEDVGAGIVRGTDAFVDSLTSGVHLTVVTVAAVAAGILLAALTFSPPGIAELLGRIFALMCKNTGQCDLGFIMAGFASANIILLALVIATFKGFEVAQAAAGADANEIADAVDDIQADVDKLKRNQFVVLALLLNLQNIETLTNVIPEVADELDDSDRADLLAMFKLPSKDEEVEARNDDRAIAEAEDDRAPF